MTEVNKIILPLLSNSMWKNILIYDKASNKLSLHVLFYDFEEGPVDINQAAITAEPCKFSVDERTLIKTDTLQDLQKEAIGLLKENLENAIKDLEEQLESGVVVSREIDGTLTVLRPEG